MTDSKRADIINTILFLTGADQLGPSYSDRDQSYLAADHG